MPGFSKAPRTRFVFLPVLALLWLISVPGLAEQRVRHGGLLLTPEEVAALPAAPAVRVEPGWGTLDTTTYTVGACESTVRSSTQPAEIFNCQKATPVLGPSTIVGLGFPVHLPNGALIEAITARYYDTHLTTDPSVGFYRIDGIGTLDSLIPMILPPTSSGNNTVTFIPSVPPQVDNNGGSYVVAAVLSANSAVEYEGIYSFTVWYRLQVSPDPATATFGDVPVGHVFHRFIEALAASGITAGCGSGNFCPDAALTRGQMAVFLSIALGLHFPN